MGFLVPEFMIEYLDLGGGGGGGHALTPPLLRPSTTLCHGLNSLPPQNQMLSTASVCTVKINNSMVVLLQFQYYIDSAENPLFMLGHMSKQLNFGRMLR